MRRRRLPGALPRRASSSASKSASARLPPATSSIVPTSTLTMWRMKASASIQKLEQLARGGSAARAQPLGAQDVALEADVLGLRRGECREVVGAGQGGGARVEQPRGRPGAATTARAASNGSRTGEASTR